MLLATTEHQVNKFLSTYRIAGFLISTARKSVNLDNTYPNTTVCEARAWLIFNFYVIIKTQDVFFDYTDLSSVNINEQSETT